MKKTYTKPEISFESFLMSTSIAGDCEQPFVVNMPTEGSCAIEGTGGMNLFNADMVNICNTTPPGGLYNGLCYHNPTDANNLFNS